MEQIYANKAPTIVAAADYQGMYIAGVAAAYVLPGFYLFATRRGVIYSIWLMCATTSIVMFFLNYANFCNMVASNYLVAGTNLTISIDDSASPCINENTVLCYYQTINSELIYNGQLYAVATYTNYYYYQPSDPAPSTPQKFAPWDPLGVYSTGISTMMPALYLAISAVLYSVIIGITLSANKPQTYTELSEAPL